MNRYKVNDLVIVITGKDKGKTGKILSISKDRVIVKDVNKYKHHKKAEKPTENIIIKEKSIHISNILHFSQKENKKSKISFAKKNKKTVRVLKLTQEII